MDGSNFTLKETFLAEVFTMPNNMTQGSRDTSTNGIPDHVPDKTTVAFRAIPDDDDKLPDWQETDIGILAQHKHWFNMGYVDFFQSRIKNDKNRVIKTELISYRRQYKVNRPVFFER